MSREFNATIANRLSVSNPIDRFDNIVGNCLAISAWIRPDIVTGTRAIFTKGSNATWQYILRLNAAAVDVHIRDAAGSDTTSGGTCVASTWQQVGLQKNGASGSPANTLRAYRNGAQVATVASTRSIWDATGDLCIGGRQDIDPFDGLIAHVGVWDTESLTAEEWAALGAGVLPPHIRAENLIGYWPLWGVDSPEPNLGLTAGQAGNHMTINGSVPAGASDPDGLSRPFPRL